MSCDVSIIISTRNRAESLRETLASIDRMALPHNITAELLIVDNGSTDDTSRVVRAFQPSRMRCRPIAEPHPSKSVALNKAIRAANGDIFLFTDDDVRVPANWVEKMIEPIARKEADAVAGGVRIAPSLQREWMTAEHASMLADTTTLQKGGGQRMVGANMAIGSHVFDTIRGFDPCLGPGEKTVGLHEETLLSLQLRQVGFTIAFAFDVKVDHHIAEDRLRYPAFKKIMEKQGRSDAYLNYHWRHDGGSRLRSGIALLFWYGRLWVLTSGADRNRLEEGMSIQEMIVRRRIAYHKQMIRYIGQPRNYPNRLGIQRQ